MASSTGSNRWIIAVVVVLAIVFLNKYLLAGARVVLDRMLPESGLTSPPAEKVAAPEPTAYFEATRAVEPTEAPALAQEKVTLVIWHQWSDEQLPSIQNILERYTNSHPWITFEYYKPGDFEAQLSTAAAAGEAPDILVAGGGLIGSLAEQGLLAPLSNYNIDAFYMANRFTSPTTSAVTWEGDVWGLPWDQGGIALIYNNDLAGVQYLPNDAYDFSGLLSRASLFAAAKPGQTLFCNPAFGSQDAYHSAPIFFGMGVPGYINDYGTVTIDTPEALRAAEFLLDARSVTISNPSYDACLNGFIEGSIGMLWTGQWVIPMVENAGINYGVLPMGRPFVGVTALMMTRQAVDEASDTHALDVILHLTSAEVQKELVLANHTIPALTALANDPEIAVLPGVSGFYNALLEGEPISPSKFMSAQWSPMGLAVYNIWYEIQSPQEALRAAQEEAERLVSEMQ